MCILVTVKKHVPCLQSLHIFSVSIQTIGSLHQYVGIYLDLPLHLKTLLEALLIFQVTMLSRLCNKEGTGTAVISSMMRTVQVLHNT